MSAQPESPANFHQELQFEEAAAAERHLHLVPTPEEQTDLNFNEAMATTNERIARGLVPTRDELAYLHRAANSINHNEDGTYADPSGNLLEKDSVEEFIDNAEPNNWLLEGDELQHYTEAANFKAGYELNTKQKQEMGGLFLRDDVPIENQLATYRKMAQDRLALSDSLKDLLGEGKTYESDKEDGIGDLVKITKNGRGQRDGNKFISNQNMEQIEAHQDQIREGLEEWTTARENDEVQPLRPDFANRNAKGRGRRENGRFITNEQSDNIDANTELIYSKLPEWKKAGENGEIEPLTVDAETDPDTIDAIDNPATATPKGLRGRARAWMGRAMQVFSDRKNGVAKDPEGKLTRSERVIGATIGAVVLGGMAYAGAKGFNLFESGTAHAAEAANDPNLGNMIVDAASATEAVASDSIDKSATDAIMAALNGNEVADAAPAAAAVAEAATTTATEAGTHILQAGENPWEVASQMAGEGASVESIDAIKDRIMELNGWTEEQARNLAVGTEMKVPK